MYHMTNQKKYSFFQLSFTFEKFTFESVCFIKRFRIHCNLRPVIAENRLFNCVISFINCSFIQSIPIVSPHVRLNLVFLTLSNAAHKENQRNTSHYLYKANIKINIVSPKFYGKIFLLKLRTFDYL